MACNLERLKRLPIDEKYKQEMIRFFSNPANREACEALAEASDEEIVQHVKATENQLADWAKNGIPDEIRKAASNNDPNIEAEMMNAMQGSPMEQLPVNQGIASISPRPDLSGVPPGQIADVPMPMDMPVQQTYYSGGFVNAPRYGLGGFLKRVAKKIKKNLGPIGAIVGAVLAAPTGGMSLAWGASLGASAGTLAEGGDLREALGAGLKAYTIGSLGSAAYKGVTGKAIGDSALGQIAAKDAVKGAATDSAVNAAGTQAVTNTATEELAKTAAEGSALSDLQKAGRALGVGSYVYGLTEEPDTGSSEPYVSDLDAYYDCVAKNGAENCPMPESIKGPPPKQFGQLPNTQGGEFVSTLPPLPVNYQYGGAVNTIGTETSDSQPAWLSDNEFVMTADAVRGAGNGNIDKGAEEMYRLMAQLEQRGRS
jgi:hypothetical protein